ncbi:MAG: hypothetical protein KDB07_00865 [Planctomycetes bacterium]|nr:hypothetical protein [Planctomycetota bacterium]
MNKFFALALVLLALPVLAGCSRSGALFFTGVVLGAVVNEALDDDEVIIVEEHHYHHHNKHHYHYETHRHAPKHNSQAFR